MRNEKWSGLPFHHCLPFLIRVIVINKSSKTGTIDMNSIQMIESTAENFSDPIIAVAAKRNPSMCEPASPRNIEALGRLKNRKPVVAPAMIKEKIFDS